MKYSVYLDYDQMNLIYQCLQECCVDKNQLKKIEVAMRVAQMSYGVRGSLDNVEIVV